MSSNSLPIGLLFPMEFEADPIWKKLAGPERMREGLPTKQGEWNGVPIVSARTGMGHAGLETKVAGWLKKNPCRAVILAGLAGALDPAWEEGDLTTHQADSWKEFHEWTLRSPSLRPSRWHTAKEIIETGEAKLELGRKTGCGIVEMEWDYVAEACTQQKVPLVGLRAVSDHADRLLPADLFLLGCDRETGKSTAGKLAAHMIFRPWRLRELIPAAMACTHARNEMSRALVCFLDELAGK